jgi:phosphatidylserine/phosphatidylglycerophosphate/cardiolipin synthase-like enzyme
MEMDENSAAHGCENCPLASFSASNRRITKGLPRGASTLKLIVEPGDGLARIINGIQKAKKSLELLIFRFDLSEVERALVEATERGVFVHALIAFTNRGGEEHLRKLEMRLLEHGISVARTAGDLIRYHGKMMLVDRKELYLLSFNFTHLDVQHSRCFGLVTRNTSLLREAIKLFEADTKRQPYTAGNSKFVVSPINARDILASFLKGAKKELLIYDPEISDQAMLRILLAHKNLGIDVRIIGKATQNQLDVRRLSGLRLHTRTIIRDRNQAFVGSQSLRKRELDSRREIGIIFRNRAIISELIRVFEQDWKASMPEQETHAFPVHKTAKQMAKVISKNLPVTPLVRQVVKAIEKKGDLEFRPQEIEETVRSALREAVKDSVKDATKEVIKNVVNNSAGKEADTE